MYMESATFRFCMITTTYEKNMFTSVATFPSLFYFFKKHTSLWLKQQQQNWQLLNACISIFLLFYHLSQKKQLHKNKTILAFLYFSTNFRKELNCFRYENMIEKLYCSDSFNANYPNTAKINLMQANVSCCFFHLRISFTTKKKI